MRHPEKEIEAIESAEQAGRFGTILTFLRMSGPGFLQSSLSLGGGSLASSLFLGVLGGLALLWVQPLAMMLGLVMLSAITYVTLATERSPFEAIRNEINPVLAWGWLGASLMANMVWALPQYALAYGAITENLFNGYFSSLNGEGVAFKDVFSVKLGVSFLILIAVAAMSLPHGKGRLGFKINEWILKGLVGIIVVSFMGVVVQLIRYNQFQWIDTLKGLIPNPQHLLKPIEGMQVHIDAIADPQAQAYWTSYILGKQREVMIAAAAAVVGINMTFLMPYSLLGKKWNWSMQRFARFDLWIGFFLPFSLATACVVVASASQFHGQVLEGITVDAGGQYAVTDSMSSRYVPQMEGLIAGRSAALPEIALEAKEIELSAMLVNRDNVGLAVSLERLFGNPFLAQKVFGIGVLAVALSSASLMMIISGFCVCEATGSAHGGLVHRLGMLFGATGVFWPFLWAGQSKAYLAVVASTVGFIFIPIAYLAFFLMMNSSRILGDRQPRGRSRIIWNALMLVSLSIVGVASFWTSWNKSLFGFSVGKVFWGVFILLLVAGSFYMRRKKRSALSEG